MEFEDIWVQIFPFLLELLSEKTSKTFLSTWIYYSKGLEGL
jgi:hypothetical protein